MAARTHPARCCSLRLPPNRMMAAPPHQGQTIRVPPQIRVGGQQATHGQPLGRPRARPPRGQAERGAIVPVARTADGDTSRRFGQLGQPNPGTSGPAGTVLAMNQPVRLRRAREARISTDKVLRDALDLTHERGRHKARVFASALGITTSSWRYLHDQIRESLPEAGGPDHSDHSVRSRLRGGRDDRRDARARVIRPRRESVMRD